jgi:hypothetical protein
LVAAVHSQSCVAALHTLPVEHEAALVQGFPSQRPVLLLQRVGPHTRAGDAAQFGKHTPTRPSSDTGRHA